MTSFQDGRVGVSTSKYIEFYRPHLLKMTTGEVRCGDQTIENFVATSFMEGPMQANLLHIELLSDR